MKIAIYIDTENKNDVQAIGKIHKALSNSADQKQLDEYIKRLVKQLVDGVKQ